MKFRVYIKPYKPNLASIYLAVTPVAPFAEYTPRANRDIPPAAAKTLSQSVNSACAPDPITDPAVLQSKFTD